MILFNLPDPKDRFMCDGAKRYLLIKTSIVIATLSLGISSCSSSPDIREQERARYEALEDDLISKQVAESRRQQAQMRIDSRMRKLAEEQVEIERKKPAPIPAEVSDTVGDWSLLYLPSPIDGNTLCAVVSKPVIVLNGTLDTQVRVIIDQSTVFLRTDATFDTDTPETGFRVNAGLPLPFDRFHNELTAIVDFGYPQLISALQSGSTLSASFAYSPQLSAAETHVVEFTLATINTALEQLDTCSNSESDSEQTTDLVGS